MPDSLYESVEAMALLFGHQLVEAVRAARLDELAALGLGRAARPSTGKLLRRGRGRPRGSKNKTKGAMG